LFLCIIGAFVGSGVAVLRRQMRQLAWLNEHDARTGLLSHAGLMMALQARLVDSSLPPTALIVVIQLCNLLDIQNAFGPEFGDALLQRICERGRELVADEFPIALIQPDRLAVMLPGGPDTQKLRDGMEARLREPYDVEGVKAYVDFAVGGAVFPDHADTPRELLQKASIAMHLAATQKVPSFLYDRRVDKTSRDNLVLLGMVPAALISKEFEIWHQAKVSLATGGVIGSEALLRWRHPERGLIPPGLFIPFVEASPLIDHLTHWVIGESLGHKAGWAARGSTMTVSINLSGRNLHNRSLVRVLLDTVSEHGIVPEEVDLEITESAVMHDFDHCAALIGILRDEGFRVSIDDFGTGQSSLAYLKRLPVTALKIDQAFVRNLATDPADQKIARAIVDLARALGLRSIAEGVEDEEAATILRDLGCDYAQGYLFQRPCPNDEFVAWVEGRALVAPVEGDRR
jgi:predicted signal transduction protein with EAL and GGDEF domain